MKKYLLVLLLVIFVIPSIAFAVCGGDSQGNFSCNTPTINGGWSDWGVCSASCGNGTQTRVCNNPSPSVLGTTCSGDSSKDCFIKECPPPKTNNEVCSDIFGLNWVWNGTKNTAGGLNCDCKDGYVASDNGCIIAPTKVEITPTIKEITAETPTVKKETVITSKQNLTKKIQIEKNTAPVSNLSVIAQPVPITETINVIPQVNQEPVKKVSWFRKIFNWFIGK